MMQTIEAMLDRTSGHHWGEQERHEFLSRMEHKLHTKQAIRRGRRRHANWFSAKRATMTA